MHWNCERCDFELVEIQKNTLFEIVKTLDPNFLGLPDNWPDLDFKWIKICPSCNSYPLGIDLEEGFPIRTKSGGKYKFNELDFVKAREHTEYQKEILKSEICGCFRCCKTFSPDEIDQWHGEETDEYEPLALCPKCSVDSVIGSASGYPIEPSFLKKMHDFWFSPSQRSKTINAYRDDL